MATSLAGEHVDVQDHQALGGVPDRSSGQYLTRFPTPPALSVSTITVVVGSSILKSPYWNCCDGRRSQPGTQNRLLALWPPTPTTWRSAMDSRSALRSSAS